MSTSGVCVTATRQRTRQYRQRSKTLRPQAHAESCQAAAMGPLIMKLLLVTLLVCGASGRDLLQAPTAAQALASNSDLSTMAAALTASNITLPSDPITLFLPVNAAFDKAINTSALTCISGDLNSDLSTKYCSSAAALLQSTNLPYLLLSHAVTGIFPSASLANGTVLRSISGVILKAATINGTVYINNAPVVTPDVAISNGVVHLLGSVISKDAAFDTVSVPGVTQPVPGGYNYTTVIGGEKLADVGPFGTDANQTMRELVMKTYEGQIPSYREIRNAIATHDGPYTKPSMLRLDPTLGSSTTGKYRATRGAGNEIPWNVPIDMSVQLPADNETLAYLPVLSLAGLIKSKQISCVDLTHVFLDRLQKYNYVLQNVVTYTTKMALDQAAAMDALLAKDIYLGPLMCIPYGLKDLIAVPGYRTTWGTDGYIDQYINHEAFGYKKLKEAGAILIAKLTTGAMASGNVWWGGETKNPWNIVQGASGSSAGPGSATSAGQVPFSLGTETGGSIISPAVTNGVSAIRASFGIVSRSWIMALSQSLDHLGPFARTAADLAVILDAIRGYDPDDIDSIDVNLPDPFSINITSLKIGYVPDAVNWVRPPVTNVSTTQWPTATLPSPGIVFNMSEVISTLGGLGAQMVPLPGFPTGTAGLAAGGSLPTSGPGSTALQTWLNYTIPGGRAMLTTIMYAETASGFDQWLRSGLADQNRNQNSWPTQLRAGRLIPAVEYVSANRARVLTCKQLAAILEQVDAVIVPHGGDTTMGNLCSIPHVAIPVGQLDLPDAPTSARKQTISVSIYAPVYGDAVALAVAMAYQSVTDHHLQRPPIDAVEPNIVRQSLNSPWSVTRLPPGSYQAAAVKINGTNEDAPAPAWLSAPGPSAAAAPTTAVSG
ncbi:hypothetical protein WJX72_011863 [[Myrmecia] bisecta]|uniref:FAS1 domain-containing protein n=1 Tax=[Myrmecia] bisecta TaxID=41462 RepID=A0AAW1PTE5_9CHLO